MTPPTELSHRWYLAEWAKAVGKIQADAQRELGWPKATASDLWRGRQRYNQELVDQVSNWLNVRPYELLLPPNEALALRDMRKSAQQIASAEVHEIDFLPPVRPVQRRRTGRAS
ncbi:hypothetical protein GCM10010983_51940 [Caulobacter rhizosphaerae]|nr:hypothetical protein GCM10010983_51940 [Caulobacter rhizosphaerae]